MREILKGMLRNAGHIIVGEASNGEQVAGILGVLGVLGALAVEKPFLARTALS